MLDLSDKIKAIGFMDRSGRLDDHRAISLKDKKKRRKKNKVARSQRRKNKLRK